jgi:hypothetical protein
MVMPHQVLWRLGLGILAILAIVLVALLLWEVLGARSVARRLQVLAEAGKPASLQQWAEQVPPDGQEASAQMAEVARVLASHGSSMAQLWQRKYEAGDWPTDDDRKLLHDLAEGESFAKLREIARKLSLAPRPLRLGVDKGLSTEVIGAALENLFGPIRHLARFCILWATHYRLDGKPTEALKILRLNFQRAHLYPPFLIGFLVQAAVLQSSMNEANEILQTSAVDPELLDLLEKDLRSLPLQQLWAEAVSTERVLGLESLRELRQKGIFLPPPFWHRTLLNYLDTCEVLESCSLDTIYQSGLGAGDQLGERLRQAARRRYSPWNAVVELTVPAFETAHTAAVRLTVLRNCLLVVCRVKRLPDTAPEGSLDITKIGLAPEYVTDPFSGEPLRVVHKNGGWYVYSVGPDRVDDAGKVETLTENWGFGPPKQKFGNSPTK